jgi:uncharacterized protein
VSPDPRALEARLDARLAELGSLLVAYSGGVDSAYLAARAHRVLGGRMLAVTADSESLAASDRERAERVARAQGFPHLVIRTRELERPGYVRNDGARCFHCKSELYERLQPLAAARGLAHVADGTILDDLGESRPGRRAALAAGVVSPLADSGLDKRAVRALSRDLGLETAEQPASPCLASRVALGVRVTRPALARVERAEAALKALGFRELRVRHLDERQARVEIAAEELPRLSEQALRAAVLQAVRDAGYAAVEIDPAGYRRGGASRAAIPARMPDP